MLWRVSMTDKNLPYFAVDRNSIAGFDALIIIRQAWHSLAIARSALLEFGEQIGTQAMLAELFNHETRTMPAKLMPNRMGRQKFTRRHEQRCAGFFHQPAGEAKMVGVKVRDDDPIDRAIESVNYFCPGLAYGVIREAGINNHPCIFIAQQPEIDVIQLKRKWHAQPENAGGDFNQGTVFRWMGVREMQRHG